MNNRHSQKTTIYLLHTYLYQIDFTVSNLKSYKRFKINKFRNKGQYSRSKLYYNMSMRTFKSLPVNNHQYLILNSMDEMLIKLTRKFFKTSQREHQFLQFYFGRLETKNWKLPNCWEFQSQDNITLNNRSIPRILNILYDISIENFIEIIGKISRSKFLCISM